MLERAYAKLNLSLDVLCKTESGYHDMRMIMQSIEFGDDIEIVLTDNGHFSLDPGRSWLPSDDRNLAMRAAKLFLRDTGLGASMRIRKRTPVCAGMGGGSSDAAAVLRALNTLTGFGKTPDELRTIALELGSDVPFCVQGGTALAEGRGEILTKLPALPDCRIVICKPSFPISTPELFARIDARKSRIRPDTSGIIEALRQQNITEVSRRCYNVFEDVLENRSGEISAIKNALLSGGAVGAAMTGTGSAVFGIFTDIQAAENTFSRLSDLYSECFITMPSPFVEI